MEDTEVVFVKYANGKHFFKVGKNQFEEVYRVGSIWQHHIVVAKTLIDRNLIADLKQIDHQHILPSHDAEFEAYLAQAKKSE